MSGFQPPTAAPRHPPPPPPPTTAHPAEPLRSRATSVSAWMDFILVLDAAGNLVPANMVAGQVVAPAGLVGNGPGVAAQAGLAVFPAFLNGPEFDEADADLDDDDDSWKVVSSRKYGMARGAHRGVEDPPVQEAIPCLLEYEWVPKSKAAPLRAVKQWSNVRKGGFVGSKEGPAVLIYPCYDPESN